MNIEEIRNLYAEEKIIWREHCLSRMIERDIQEDEIAAAIQSGSIIEDYPEDYPYPSCLIMGKSGEKTIHVVVGQDADTLFMITTYVPDTIVFEEDLKTRKEK